MTTNNKAMSRTKRKRSMIYSV